MFPVRVASSLNRLDFPAPANPSKTNGVFSHKQVDKCFRFRSIVGVSINGSGNDSDGLLGEETNEKQEEVREI